MPETESRRQLLASVGATGVAALAGCTFDRAQGVDYGAGLGRRGVVDGRS